MGEAFIRRRFRREPEPTPEPTPTSLVLLSPQNGLASGYSVGGNASVSGSAIVESGDGGFWLSPAVDLTNYSTLTVRGIQRAAAYNVSRVRVGSTSGKVFNIVEMPEAEATWSTTINTLDAVTINVAGLSGAYYIGTASIRSYLEVTEITLT